MKTMLVRIAFATVLVAAAAHGLRAQRDWPTYGYDAGGTRFSPLTQINTSHVSRLQRYNTPITFQARDGKQYVGAHAAGGGFSDRQTGDSLTACPSTSCIIITNAIIKG